MNLHAFAYFVLTILVNLILVKLFFYGSQQTITDRSLLRRKRILLILGLIGWQIYIYAIASTGILKNFDFPPRFFIYLVLPAFMFTGIFIYRKRHQPWISAIPEHWLIYFQTFRILVESLFVVSVAQGVLHPNVTIEGYNFDMLLGISAPIIAFLVYQKPVLPRRLILWWNYIGLGVLASVIFVFITTIYRPDFYGFEHNLMPIEFGTYPYVLVAGFLMPSAVFIHILSIVQIKKNGLKL